MSSKLDKEFDFYLSNQNDLVLKYNNKFIVIKEEKVIGTYGTHKEALDETLKTNEIGTFLIQLCHPGVENYTFTFHSNVSFSF